MNVATSERFDSKQIAFHWKVSCPEIGGVPVETDAVAEPFLFLNKPVVTIEKCSLWPARKNCAQKCLRNRDDDISL
jgi:hypothetical protein